MCVWSSLSLARSLALSLSLGERAASILLNLLQVGEPGKRPGLDAGYLVRVKVAVQAEIPTR